MNLEQSVIEHPEVVTGQATGSETILALLTTTPRFVAVRMRSSQGRRLSRSSSWVRAPCLARQARYSGSLGVYRSRISKCTADILVAAINSLNGGTVAIEHLQGGRPIRAAGYLRWTGYPRRLAHTCAAVAATWSSGPGPARCSLQSRHKGVYVHMRGAGDGESLQPWSPSGRRHTCG